MSCWKNICIGSALGEGGRGASASITPVPSPVLPSPWFWQRGTTSSGKQAGVSSCSCYLNSGFGFLLQPFWQCSPSTAPEVRHVRRDSLLSTGFPVHDQPQPRLWLWLCPALVSSLSELLKCQSSPHPPSGPVLQAPCAALNGSSSPGFLWLCTERLPGHALGFLSYFMAFGGSSAEELWNSYPPCLGENGNWKI